MKFFPFLIGCFFGASFFISCSNASNEQPAAEVPEENWQPNMYEPSELVVIMRKMYEDNLALKEQLIAGEVPQQVPEAYRQILTAQATNPDELGDLYYAMAKAYLAGYESLTKADSSAAVPTYNAMINTCIGCHQNYCLGPIPKIEKLYIKP
jgi:hypothetical protein